MQTINLRGDGTQALLDHLRLCTAIPESYELDSSEEKLYSTYTDIHWQAVKRSMLRFDSSISDSLEA